MGRLCGHISLCYRLLLVQRGNRLEICACGRLAIVSQVIPLTDMAVEDRRNVHIPRVDEPRAHGAQVPALWHLRCHVH